jgi:hypothetical protein
VKVVRLIGFFVGLVTATSCGSSAVPAAPSTAAPAPPPLTAGLTGNWSGGASDSQGATVVAWQLTQAGSAVSGTVRTTATNPDDGSCGSCHRNKSGTISGTLTGSTLTLTMFFAAGADGDPTPACSATLTGSAPSVSGSTVVAAYSGSDTCEGAFANGTMTMHR